MAPAIAWGRTWLLALALAGLAVGGWEAWWRLHGHRPSVEAVDESWILAFGELRPDSTVVLGTSRVQAALDPRIWAEETGGQAPLMLALPGNSPLPILERLADDEGFAGLVLIDLLPMFFFDASGSSQERGAGLLRAYDAARASPSRWCEAWLAVNVGGSLVLRNPRLTPQELVRAALRGELPDPSVASMRADRFAPVDFRRLAPFPDWTPALGFLGRRYGVAETSGRPATEVEVDALLTRLEAAVSRLQARGGRAVALRLPACGERAAIEERRFPRARYWDRFAGSTSALAVHLDDVADFPRFPCYDGSHVDAGDAPAFTRALVALVERLLAGG